MAATVGPATLEPVGSVRHTEPDDLPVVVELGGRDPYVRGCGARARGRRRALGLLRQRRANLRRASGASVWARDLAKADRVARRIEAGVVRVNDFGWSYGAGVAPRGGVKGSGFGRTASKHGPYEAAQVKPIDSGRGRIRPAWWFPYDAPTERALRAPLDVLHGSRGERLRAARRHRRHVRHIVKRSSKR